MARTEINAQERYDQRMRDARQFKFFGIRPVWQIGKGDIEGFIHDEVVRQSHDTRVRDDGGVRVEWMLDAWHYAQAEERRTPTVDDILILGAKVEPKYNAVRGKPEFRHENVYIGDRMGVFPPFLRQCTEHLAAQAGDVVPGIAEPGFLGGLFIESFKEQVQEITTVDEWYLAYEWIHPFRDGNGRTGKILYNWLEGTLNEPILVRDYFGSGNP